MSEAGAFAREREAIAARLALLGFPPERSEIVFALEGDPATPPSADAVCLVSRSATIPPGYVAVWRRGFSRRMPLWEGVRETLGPLGGMASLLGPSSPLRIVGGRTCALPVRGAREVYLVREHLPEAAARRGPAWSDRALDCALSFFHTGKTPIVGATLASLITVLLAAAAFAWLGEGAARAFMGVLFIVSTVICVAAEPWARRYYLSEDPREVVLDEVAGMSLALLTVTGPWWPVGCALAFVLFRFFDVTKIGVHWVEERRWPGTIVWDDVLAGLYAAVLTALLPFVLRLVW